MSYDITHSNENASDGTLTDGAAAPRRGYQPTDEKDFGTKSMETLQRAAAELSFLLDRDYPRETAVEFVGNRYQFTTRQRLFLNRGVSGEAKRAARAAKHLKLEDLRGRDVCIDGFNVIVPLEVALVRSPLIRAQDGAIRDLAGINGTYRSVEQTMQAIDLVLDLLTEAQVASATFYFDRPVRNSGRLAKTIADYVRALANIQPSLPKVQAALVDNVDSELAGRAYVATNDSAVIDHCQSWASLDAAALNRVDDAWVLDAIAPDEDPLYPDPARDILEADASTFGTSAASDEKGPASRIPMIPISVQDPGDTFLS